MDFRNTVGNSFPSCKPRVRASRHPANQRKPMHLYMPAVSAAHALSLLLLTRRLCTPSYLCQWLRLKPCSRRTNWTQM